MSERRLTVLYGSETGTAQDVAERIGRGGKRHLFTTCVLALDDYPVVRLRLVCKNNIQKIFQFKGTL